MEVNIIYNINIGDKNIAFIETQGEFGDAVAYCL